jgi:predicted RNA-binding protein
MDQCIFRNHENWFQRITLGSQYMTEAVKIISIRIHAEERRIPAKFTLLLYLGIDLLYNAFLLIYKMPLNGF